MAWRIQSGVRPVNHGHEANNNMAAAVAGLALFSLLALLAWNRLSGIARASSLLLLPLLVYAGGNWSRRGQESLALEQIRHQPAPFGNLIAEDEQVLWLDRLLPTWAVLHRPSYIDEQQMAGIVFNRQTSLESFRRKELMHVTDGQNRDCRIVVLSEESHSQCRPDETAIRQACQRANGELSWFVLPYRLPSEPRSTWSPAGMRNTSYYLYACRDWGYKTPGNRTP